MSLERVFPAKILLFGEYTILNGGQALAMPLKSYGGRWNFEKKDAGLKGFYDFLKSFDFLDGEKIEHFIDKQPAFESNIPRGYGMGSSGALTAAAYEAFRNEQVLDLGDLKRALSVMEGYFHGSSSGFDPLTSYVGKCIHHSAEGTRIVDSMPELGKLGIYDSGSSRNSGKMIEVYKSKLSSKSFQEQLNKLMALNAEAINALLKGDDATLKQCFFQISDLQWESFNEMITDNLKQLWLRGLEGGEYALKLSGAGGGGTYLVYGKLASENIESLS